jgi:hypothetical protein
VTGGIRYDDPKVMLDRSQAVYSADRLVLVSRGSLSTVGDTGVYKKRVRDASGAIIDYEQKLVTTNNLYKTYYTGKYTAEDLAFRPDWCYWGCDIITPATYGVFVGNALDCCDNKLSAEGVMVPEETRKYINSWSFLKWDEFPTRPPLVGGGDCALFTVRFRTGNMYEVGAFNLRGSMSSLGKHMETSGEVPTRFDYSLQLMKPLDITTMGLPLTVIPCSWQRL